MLLAFVLLIFLTESRVKSLNITTGTTKEMPTTVTTEAPSSVENLSPPKVVATPDYPVASGQKVRLLCSTTLETAFFTWIWQQFHNQTTRTLDGGRELLLTEPEQSGLYRCYARNHQSGPIMSPVHTVLIVSVPTTVGEKLGIAAFVLSLLVLTTIISGLIWMSWQSLGGTLTASSPAVKGAAGSEVASKGGLPQAVDDGDVYINYTSTNHAYTDLDPSSATGENVYSSLS